MNINPELKKWFLNKNKEHILSGVRDFKKNNWYEGSVQSTMSFYEESQYFFDHVITMQKCGSNHVSDWFVNFGCPIKERSVEEMMHLMAQFRDGAISYNMLFQEPK